MSAIEDIARRLPDIDYVCPVVDELAAACALREHLRVLGLEAPEVRWVGDAEAGYLEGLSDRFIPGTTK